jgi:NADPH-dependent 2,4-dienoyl-CoA reductase/sulfur reductase-like enzyme
MHETRYLIVGGGMTADAAVRGIREHDPEGTITLVGAESHPPYKRPPLTKGLWSGADEAKVWLNTEADLRLGRRIVALDPAARTATDDKGETYRYERVLLATGGRPRELPGAEGVVYYRTLDDFRRLRDGTKEGDAVVVIGGGFVGSELAASLTTAGRRVTMVFPEPSVAWRVLPGGLAESVTELYRERGVDVRAGETVTAARGNAVELGSGETIEAAAVVAGLGILPATELAEAAGLPVDDGIPVDAYGRVEGFEDVFAAGDVARFPQPDLGRSMRVEHEDHAKSHGRAVGANMAGANTPYTHLPFFYSDLFDLGYEAVGVLDSRLEVLEQWEEPNRKGIVAYLDEERRPVGFLLWNTWDKVDAATEVIRARQPVGEHALV